MSVVNLDLALQTWEEILSCQPGHAPTYDEAVRILLENARFAEAEQWLQRGVENCPDNIGLALGYAYAAQRRDAWAEAEQRWHAANIAFPTQIEPPIGMAEAASRRCDWATADVRWQAVIDRAPTFWPAIVHRANSLRELQRIDAAEELLAQAIAAFPTVPNLYLEYAHFANLRADWQESARRWGMIRSLFPEIQNAPTQEAFALTQLGRFDEAENALTLAADAASPDRAFELTQEHAWVALRRQDFREAKRRFDVSIEKFPDRAGGYLGAAQAVGGMGLPYEAEALLSLGVERCPGDPVLAIQHLELVSVLAKDDSAFAERSIRYFSTFRTHFPNEPIGFILQIRSYINSSKPDDAEAIAQVGMKVFPGNAELPIEYGRCAEARKEYGIAIDRYGKAVELNADRPEGYVGLARNYAMTSRRAEAEAVLQKAMNIVPQSSSVHIAYAQLATQTHDWAEAVRRWSAVHAKFPNEEEIAHSLFEARLAAVDDDTEPTAQHESKQTVSAISAEMQPGEPPTVAALVEHFESLGGGDGQGCEFGVFQRAAGAEPMGLLRWSNMEPTDLVTALAARFAGVGDEAQTLIGKSKWLHKEEYVTSDSKYGMYMHSFLSTDDLDEEKAQFILRKRLKILTTKMIADLSKGQKIFVYRMLSRNLSDEEIDAIHAEIRKFGENTFLYVRYETESEPNGTVQAIRPGLLIGYIDRFAFSRDITRIGPANESWLKICCNAYRLRSSTRGA